MLGRIINHSEPQGAEEHHRSEGKYVFKHRRCSVNIYASRHVTTCNKRHKHDKSEWTMYRHCRGGEIKGGKVFFCVLFVWLRWVCCTCGVYESERAAVLVWGDAVCWGVVLYSKKSNLIGHGKHLSGIVSNRYEMDTMVDTRVSQTSNITKEDGLTIWRDINE